MMGQNKYRILVLTSDKYADALKVYLWLIRKHWKNHPEIVVGGYTKPEWALPDRVEFMSIGKQSDYPVNRWSDGLIKLLTGQFVDDVFILMLEDYWVIEDVPAHIVDMCCDYMHQFNYVAKLDLTGDRLHAGGASLYGKLDYIDLIWSDPNSPYHLSLMTGFWRRTHLLSVLVPNETPWQVEIDGTRRLSARRNETIVLGTNAWPIKHTLGLRGGNADVLTAELPQDDVDGLNRFNLLSRWKQ